MKVKEALVTSIKLLNEKNIDEARLNSKLLLGHILNLRKEELIINQDKEISIEDENKFFENVQKMLDRLSYSIYIR